ncbi:hypothetical protein ACFX1S_046959 [Malus domestica]
MVAISLKPVFSIGVLTLFLVLVFEVLICGSLGTKNYVKYGFLIEFVNAGANWIYGVLGGWLNGDFACSGYKDTSLLFHQRVMDSFKWIATGALIKREEIYVTVLVLLIF